MGLFKWLLIGAGATYVEHVIADDDDDC